MNLYKFTEFSFGFGIFSMFSESKSLILMEKENTQKTKIT